MTDVFTIQGTVLSKVPCEIERQRRAANLNVPLESIPLTYGSIRIGVNLIKINNSTFSIERFNSEEFDEERFILEISYRYNIDLRDGSLVEEHQIVNSINRQDILDITLDNTYTSEKHNVKIIRPGANGEKSIKSYFTKAWADNIVKVESPQLNPSPNKITIQESFSKLSNEVLRRPLVFS